MLSVPIVTLVKQWKSTFCTAENSDNNLIPFPIQTVGTLETTSAAVTDSMYVLDGCVVLTFQDRILT
jgi:hypothetical protein